MILAGANKTRHDVLEKACNVKCMKAWNDPVGHDLGGGFIQAERCVACLNLKSQ